MRSRCHGLAILQGIRIVGAESKREGDAVELQGGDVCVDDNMATLSNLTGETRTLDSAELQDRAWMISDLKVSALWACLLCLSLISQQMSCCVVTSVH